MISNKQIKKLNDKCLQFPKRTTNDLTEDFNSFNDFIENGFKQQNNNLNLNIKLSEFEIDLFFECFKYKKIKPGIYKYNKSIVTIKPNTSLFQCIRLYGHSKYISGRELNLDLLNNSDNQKISFFDLFK